MRKNIIITIVALLLIGLLSFPAFGQSSERDLSTLNWNIAQELRVVIEAFRIGLDCPIPKMHEDSTSGKYTTNPMWQGSPIVGSFNDPMTSGYEIYEEFLIDPINWHTQLQVINDTTIHTGGAITAPLTKSYLGDTLSSWFVTITDGASDNLDTICIVPDTVGGALLMRCNDADNDLVGIQLKKEMFKLAVGKRLWMEWRVATKYHFTQHEYMFGLGTIDSSPITAHSDFLGFRKVDADTVYDAVCEFNTIESALVVHANTEALTADSLGWHRYGAYWDGVNTVTFYYDGAAIGTVASLDSICNDEALSPMAFVKAGEASTVYEANILLDYLKIIAER